MKFVARHDKSISSLAFLIMMIGHIFNTERIFPRLHISNSIGATAFLLVAWSIVIEGRLNKWRWLLVFASFVTLFEVIGFTVMQNGEYFLIANVPLLILAASVAPCLFNMIVLGIVGWYDSGTDTVH